MISTPHGTSIPVSLHRPRRAEGAGVNSVLTVLMCHGNAEDLGSAADAARHLSSTTGHNVCVFDYDGYGLSTGGGGRRVKPSSKRAIACAHAVFVRVFPTTLLMPVTCGAVLTPASSAPPPCRSIPRRTWWTPSVWTPATLSCLGAVWVPGRRVRWRPVYSPGASSSCRRWRLHCAWGSARAQVVAAAATCSTTRLWRTRSTASRWSFTAPKTASCRFLTAKSCTVSCPTQRHQCGLTAPATTTSTRLQGGGFTAGSRNFWGSCTADCTQCIN